MNVTEEMDLESLLGEMAITPDVVSAQKTRVDLLQGQMEEEYNDGEWSELDIRLKSVQWMSGNVLEWPLDGFRIFEDEHQLCVVGSLKNAFSLDDLGMLFGERPCCVISLCQGEIPKAVKKEWQGLVASKSFRHISVDLPDWNAKNLEDGIVNANACLREWMFFIMELRRVWQELENKGRRLVVLFHCYAGVNRSPAAALAWLMVSCGFDLNQALRCLMMERKALKPLSKREYALHALLVVEQFQDQVRDLAWHFRKSRRG